MATSETHYGVLTAARDIDQWSVTDYGTDRETAERDAARSKPDWSYTTELVTRRVTITAWKTATGRALRGDRSTQA